MQLGLQLVMVLGHYGSLNNIMAELETEVELLKKEVSDMKLIHGRLDEAITKITDVSNSIHRMLAVHEEKLNQQEEAVYAAEELIEQRRTEFQNELKELHSRITTNTKEIMTVASKQHQEHSAAIQQVKEELNKRVGILEKWRHVLIGGSIVIGFILHKMMDFT